MPDEFFAHVAFLGIVVQTANALLFAALFLALRRLASHRAYLRDWSFAYAGLALAIAALFARYLASDDFRGTRGSDFANADVPLTRVFYAVYQAGKIAFFAALLTGAARFAGRRLPIRRRGLAIVLGAYALIAVLTTRNLDSLVILQAPVAIVATTWSAVILFGVAREKRSFGTRIAGAACALYALLWLAYAWSFARPESTGDAVAGVLRSLSRYNSFIDVMTQSLLGVGILVTLFQDLGREAESSRQERAALSKRLAQSRHLESLGALVSGVAHELNNPLTAILGYSEEMLDAATGGTGTPDPNSARVIHEQAQRCRAIVRDLLSVARPRAPAREPVAPADVVDRVVRGFTPELKRAGVKVDVAVEPELPTLDVDSSGLEQVLANLVDNAIDASPPGGTVEVSARQVGEQCEFAVQDEGPGIPAQFAERVFEPFFTTKKAGEGTGLGLAVSHRIVVMHGGTIAVAGRPDGGSGARFVVRLPLQGSEPGLSRLVDRMRTPMPRSRPQPAATARPIRILLVDDEAAVRAVLKRRLEHYGWNIVEAEDGTDALAKLRSTPAPFDVAITDVQMRGLSGLALHEQFGKEAPDLARRTIAITGNLHAPEVARLVAASGCQVFEKPLDMDRLVTSVAAIAGLALTPPVSG